MKRKISAARYKREYPKPLRDVIDTRPWYGRTWIDLSCGHGTIRRKSKLPAKIRCICCWQDKYRRMNNLPSFP